MIIVCDCSPLIALALCDQLALLDMIFDEVVIPERVYVEATVSEKPEALKIAAYAQGKVHRAENSKPAALLGAALGKGEIEAMALYWEKGADYLLIDEDKGRRFARKNGITIIGSLGILLYAKKMSLIPAVKPLLHILRASNIRIADSLYESALKQAEELGK
jgi:predicted nucleic acid-binding protein